MVKSEAEQKFDKYCVQLEKYGVTEDVHSPNMALLRRKARKQLIEMSKEENDHTKAVNRLWMVGYYRPYQIYAQSSEAEIESVTLLTIFCGELHELLAISSKYSAQLNLFIGDLHRYMPSDEIQKTLAQCFYARSIELDSSQGRAFSVLAAVWENRQIVQKIRLLLLSQLASKPYDTSKSLQEILNSSDVSKNEKEEKKTSLLNVLKKFLNWMLFSTVLRSDNFQNTSEFIQMFKSSIELKDSEDDWSMVLSVCRLASQLAMQKEGFGRFNACFDVISEVHLNLFTKFTPTSSEFSKRLLLEATAWISTAGEVFERIDLNRNETYIQTMPNFSKMRWDKLNDVVMEHLNEVFTEISDESLLNSITSSELVGFLLNGPNVFSKKILGNLVQKVIELNNSPFVRSDDPSGPLLERANPASPRRLDVPLAALSLGKNQKDLEDWKPVYILMQLDAILKKVNILREIWKLDEFICVLPSTVLHQLDELKEKNKTVRPVIRALMDAQSEGRIVMKKCENIRECTLKLVESARNDSEHENDHKEIVAVLRENSNEDVERIEGVRFYTTDGFYKKCLE